jgi:hypothetical protein
VLLVPLVYRWLVRQEADILRRGRRLHPGEMQDARRIGLRRAGQVRILVVARIPLPAAFILRRLGRFSRVALSDPVALTAGSGIFCRRRSGETRRVLRHELVHVQQYERLGRRPFLKRYIRDCIVDGYADSPLEKEARQRSAFHPGDR